MSLFLYYYHYYARTSSAIAQKGLEKASWHSGSWYSLWNKVRTSSGVTSKALSAWYPLIKNLSQNVAPEQFMNLFATFYS